MHDIDNYRGITLTSWRESGTFGRDRLIEDHLFTLNGICALRNSSRLKTYIAFLDLSKALDRVWKEGLFYLLWNNVVQVKVCRLLKELYRTVSNKVVLGELESEWFNKDNGVKQRCILSLSLFSVMMKDLTDMLSEHNIGVPIAF